jgi:hypothetical protein
MESKYRLKAMGYDFDMVAEIVSKIFKIDAGEILLPGKHPKRVKARSFFASPEFR